MSPICRYMCAIVVGGMRRRDPRTSAHPYPSSFKSLSPLSSSSTDHYLLEAISPIQKPPSFRRTRGVPLVMPQPFATPSPAGPQPVRLAMSLGDSAVKIKPLRCNGRARKPTTCPCFSPGFPWSAQGCHCRNAVSVLSALERLSVHSPSRQSFQPIELDNLSLSSLFVDECGLKNIMGPGRCQAFSDFSIPIHSDLRQWSTPTSTPTSVETTHVGFSRVLFS